MDTKIKLNTSSGVTKILSTGAFGFAIISFLSTAMGLNDFAFAGKTESWKGFLLSFCIQGALLTLNLNLPKFWNLLKEKKKYVALCILFIFYSVMLVTSSLFSAVYITNLSYEKTHMQDTQSIVERKTREILITSTEEIDKHLYDDNNGIMNNLRSMLNEYQIADINIPMMAELNFSFSAKDQNPNVPLSGSYTISELIQAESNRTVNVIRELSNQMTKLSELDASIKELNNKKISQVNTKLISVYGKAEQLMVDIESYRTKVTDLQKNIDEYGEKSKEESSLGNGYRSREYLYMIEYLKLQISYYEEFLKLIDYNNKDIGAEGTLKVWYDTLHDIIDRNRIYSMFINLTMFSPNDRNKDYTEAKNELYDEIKFITSCSGVSGLKTLDEFDKMYSDYEKCTEIMESFENIQNKISNTSSIVQADNQASKSDVAENTETLGEVSIIETSSETVTNEVVAIETSSETVTSEVVAIETSDETVTSEVSNETTQSEWAQNWKEIIEELHKSILKMPQNDNSTEYANDLIKLYRNNFTEISTIEEYINILFYSGIPGKAIFASVFAFMMDLASLGIGLILYWKKESI